MEKEKSTRLLKFFTVKFLYLNFWTNHALQCSPWNSFIVWSSSNIKFLVLLPRTLQWHEGNVIILEQICMKYVRHSGLFHNSHREDLIDWTFLWKASGCWDRKKKLISREEASNCLFNTKCLPWDHIGTGNVIRKETVIFLI